MADGKPMTAAEILDSLQRELESTDSYVGVASGAFENMVRKTVEAWRDAKPKPKPKTVAEAVNECSIYLFNCGKASPRTCQYCGLGPCAFGFRYPVAR